MAFIPYEKFSYTTKFKSDEILKIIKNNTEKKKNFRLLGPKSEKPYAGQIYNNIFRLSKEISFTNLFTPLVYGAIIEENGKTTIRLKMTLHMIVNIVMAIWIVTILFILINNLKALFTGNAKTDNLFTTFGMMLLGYVFMTGAFKAESKKVKEELRELFEAETD